MRVDDTNQPHDHSFGLGAQETEAHEVAQHTDAAAGHGLFDQLQSSAEHFGGHLEIGHLDHDFGGHHDGFDGLHDSVHVFGLGIGGEEHHALHDSGLGGLHDSGLHDASQIADHHPLHVAVPVEHHDSGLGDVFHHG